MSIDDFSLDAFSLRGRGGARSDLMMQIVAGSWGRPAIRAGVPDAAGLGAAYPEAQRRYAEVAAVLRDLPKLTDPMLRRIDNRFGGS